MSVPPDGVCGYTERVTTIRFVYISVAGLVAVFGFFSNILLFVLFHTTPSKPPSHFPAFLALLDALLCFCFVVIFVVDVNMMYLELPGLFTFYHQYIVIAFSTAKVVQLLIPYMLIMATFERYTWIVKRKSTVSAKARPLSALILVIVATGIRIPAAMALTVTHFPECRDFFRTLAVDVLPWAKESTVYAAFDIYGMAFLQTFLPFITLFSLNAVIVRTLCLMSSRMRRSSFAMLPGIRPSLLSSLRRYKMPPTVRSAVYTTMAIVSTYLVCNSLHLVLTLLEVGNASILFEEFDSFQASTLYTTLGDTVSILYMTSSASRIFIYAICNPATLKQLSSNEFLERFSRRKHSSDVIL